jgi:hypothetical protein
MNQPYYESTLGIKGGAIFNLNITNYLNQLLKDKSGQKIRFISIK